MTESSSEVSWAFVPADLMASVLRPDPMEAYLIAHFRNPDLSMTEVAAALSMSRSTLYRRWNERHTRSIHAYLMRLRVAHANWLLQERAGTVTQAALESGFSSQSYFTKVYRKQMGWPPSAVLGGRIPG